MIILYSLMLQFPATLEMPHSFILQDRWLNRMHKNQRHTDTEKETLKMWEIVKNKIRTISVNNVWNRIKEQIELLFSTAFHIFLDRISIKI